jgi:hypothetical protein
MGPFTPSSPVSRWQPSYFFAHPPPFLLSSRFFQTSHSPPSSRAPFFFSSLLLSLGRLLPTLLLFLVCLDRHRRLLHQQVKLVCGVVNRLMALLRTTAMSQILRAASTQRMGQATPIPIRQILMPMSREMARQRYRGSSKRTKTTRQNTT